MPFLKAKRHRAHSVVPGVRVKVSDRGLPGHEFDPSTTKDPPCRAAISCISGKSFPEYPPRKFPSTYIDTYTTRSGNSDKFGIETVNYDDGVCLLFAATRSRYWGRDSAVYGNDKDRSPASACKQRTDA
ncbi:hypothetical protein TNCV_679191 [Trichonephila clavipes]|nr:hypothetical protein TNCV_679191 [Trichonephila clavipes]